MVTDRGFLVKVRERDDDSINVWIDGQRSSLPSPVAASLADSGVGSNGVDVVIDTERSEASVVDDDDAVATIPFALDDAGLVLLTITTSARERPDRSAECREAADHLGLEHLAQAGPDAVLRLDDEALKARTRHAITETARVRGAVRAIETGAWVQLGTMLTASHASLRDDFEASCAEIDVAAGAALEAGALGARMTGSDSVVALVPLDGVLAVRELVERRFDEGGWRRPDIVRMQSVDGTVRHLATRPAGSPLR